MSRLIYAIKLIVNVIQPIQTQNEALFVGSNTTWNLDTIATNGE